MNISQIMDKNGNELLLVDRDMLLGTLDYQEEMANQLIKSIEEVREAIKNNKN